MLFSAGVVAFLALAVHVRSSSCSAFPGPGDASYEYVLIGGGTAGGWATEMGNLTTVPGYAFSNPVLAPVEAFPHIPLLDWELLSQPQAGAANRKLHYAAGKTLGGSSAVNTMAYHRATNYTWEKMLPSFLKSSTLTAPDWAKRATPNATFKFDTPVFCSGRSSCGPLQVSYSNWVDPTSTWFAVALKAIGLGLSQTGFNSGLLSGGAYTTETIDSGTATRSSSQTSYLTWAFQNTQPGNGVTTIGDLSAAILNPFSRGSVTLSSANITDPPFIDMDWLTDPADGEVAIAAFKRLRQAWSSASLAWWKVGSEVKPGEAVQTDEEILEYVRENAIQIWHASATCAMGTDPAKGAVVDWMGKVFGVVGLRVVDASALPFALPGHPQATIYAFAEKIAAGVLEGN